MVATLLAVSGARSAPPSAAASSSATQDGVRFTLLSAGPGGGAANHYSGHGVLSPDGNWVSFWTQATDIAPPGKPGTARVVVVERATGRVKDVHQVWDGSANFGWPPPPGVASAARDGTPPVAFLSWWRDPDSLEFRQGIFVSRNGSTEQQDLDLDGRPAAGASGSPALDGQAKWLVFGSDAPGLVPWDENQAADVFARNLEFGVTYLVSATADGASGTGWSGYAHLSASGGFVAFESDADDLVDGDSNLRRDVFVQDLDSGWTERVSGPLYREDSGSTERWTATYASVAANGERAVFQAEQEPMPGQPARGTGVYAWQDDEHGGAVRLLSAPAGGGAWHDTAVTPVISSDGGWAAFLSNSRALDETKTDDEVDVFLSDLDSLFSPDVGDGPTPPPTAPPAIEPLRRISLPDLKGVREPFVEITRNGLARGATFAVISTNRALVQLDSNGLADVYLVEWPNPGQLYLPALRNAAPGAALAGSSGSD